MYIITEEMEIINTELFIGADEVETNSNVEFIETKPALVVPMYSAMKPAPSAAVDPLALRMERNQTAIQKALGSLNMLLLNTTHVEVVSTIQAIAVALINDSALSPYIKTNSLHALAALATHSGNVLFPYKRKYSTPAEILFYLASTSSRKEVASLYYVNAELIEQVPSLSKAFLNRKAIFYPQQQAAA